MRRWLPLSLALLAGGAPLAHAHTTGQAFILLLPTHLYVAGGAVVVAASFLLLALVPTRAFAAAEGLRWRLGAARCPVPPGPVSTGASLLSLLVVLLLVAAGLTGSRDPLANPLPLVVWTVWWIGFAYLHAIFGDLWAHLNPWSGLYRLATSLPALNRWRAAPPLRYPAGAGHWPAVAGLLAFAWFELIHPAPADPAVLARAVTAYLLVHFAAIVLFGERAWLGHGETFSVFFRLVSWLAPLGVAERERAGPAPRQLDVALPAVRLLAVRPPGPSGTAFILLALSSVSFDGLSRTFFWLGGLGVNPLDYPGRTALMGPNTAGLLGVFVVLALAFAGVVLMAAGLAGIEAGVSRLPGAFVLSLVPIAVGYHFAHYLPVFIVDVQHALRAVSDPFGRGWDLLGTRDLHVVASFLSDPARVYAIWHAQIAIIVVAHVAAVWVAHVLALRLTGRAGAAVLSQVPMVVLMIGYTMFGLWLLSAPSAG